MKQTITYTGYADGHDYAVTADIYPGTEEVALLKAELYGADRLATLTADEVEMLEAEGWDAFLRECAEIKEEQRAHDEDWLRFRDQLPF